MAIFLDECMDSADWIANVTKTMVQPEGYRPEKDTITLEELNELSFDYTRNGGDMGLPNHWDYPLSETDILATDKDKEKQEYILVRFDNGNGGYEYRWCEID